MKTCLNTVMKLHSQRNRDVGVAVKTSSSSTQTANEQADEDKIEPTNEDEMAKGKEHSVPATPKKQTESGADTEMPRFQSRSPAPESTMSDHDLSSKKPASEEKLSRTPSCSVRLRKFASADQLPSRRASSSENVGLKNAALGKLPVTQESEEKLQETPQNTTEDEAPPTPVTRRRSSRRLETDRDGK